MSTIIIATTGISLFLFAFKLCEYFELEVDKALERIKKLKRWSKDDNVHWDNEEREEIGIAISSQLCLIEVYKKRWLLVFLPNTFLFISFVSAVLYDLSIGTCIGTWCGKIILASYLIGAGLPVLGAGIGMLQRPTKRFLEIKEKYYRRRYIPDV